MIKKLILTAMIALSASNAVALEPQSVTERICANFQKRAGYAMMMKITKHPSDYSAFVLEMREVWVAKTYTVQQAYEYIDLLAWEEELANQDEVLAAKKFANRIYRQCMNQELFN